MLGLKFIYEMENLVGRPTMRDIFCPYTLLSLDLPNDQWPVLLAMMRLKICLICIV